MAYEIRDGQFQVKKGDKFISITTNADGQKNEYVVFKKSFAWGWTLGGDIRLIKSLALNVIRFIVESVHFCNKKILEKENEKLENMMGQVNRSTQNNQTNQEVEDTGI